MDRKKWYDPAVSIPAMSSRVRSAQLTTDLYRACMTLAVEARALLVENEGLKRLGLNAEVLAAHTGAEGGGLEVIVAEIGRLSRAIGVLVAELGQAAEELSDESIRLLHLAHQHGSYAAGWKAGIGDSSVATFRARLDHVGQERGSRFARLDAKLHTIGGLVEDLRRIALSIPPVTTMIRIVTAEVRLHTEALLATADGLKTFHGHLEEKVERMGLVRRSGVAVLRELGERDA